MRRINLFILIAITLSISLSGCQSSNVASAETAASTTSVESSNPTAIINDTPTPPVKTESTINSTNDKYTLLQVDGGDMSGSRQPMARVDIGFGTREYWAYTNEYGQLVRVTAAAILLQDDSNEPVLDGGRYYPDEATVPGTERSDLDQGHVIADSLGGVSNAYNITPQDSVLNRHGDQAYMETVIRDAGGCTDFEAIITYPDIKTQIPSHYDYTYTLKGNIIHDSFDNINPDAANKALNTENISTAEPSPVPSPPAAVQTNDITAIDTNGNGQVSIKEAKAAGFEMPITRDHWLYQYMTDRDGDGMVGE